MKEYAVQYEMRVGSSKKWVRADRARGIGIPYMLSLDDARDVMALLDEAGKYIENPAPVRLVAREVSDWEVVQL